MKKTITLLILSAATTLGAFAQNMFFPSKEGTSMLYANLDAKGKIENYTQQTVKKVEGSGSNLTISYVSQVLDKNREPIAEGIDEIPLTITIKDGVVEWDMRTFATSELNEFIEIEGDKLRIPTKLSPGDKWDDVKFTVTISMGIKIRTSMALTDQQCLAIEEITVPAGTFKCHKITQTSTATVMRRNTTTTTVTWYAEGIGMIKSETFDAKGKLQNSMMLQELKS